MSAMRRSASVSLLVLCIVLSATNVASSSSLKASTPTPTTTLRLQKVRSDLIDRVNPNRFGGRLRGAPHNMNVNGSVWPVSVYWTTIEVGTPAVHYAVCVDSGSNALFLSGKGCVGCVTTPPNVPYNPATSTTSKPLYTPFNYSYETCNPAYPTESCSIQGTMFADVVSVAGFGPAPIQVGVIEKQSSNFYQFQTIDGIMGMCGGPVTGNAFQALCVFNQNGTTYKDNICRDPRWSICFHEGTLSNGTLTFGGVDERLSDGPIVYVPSNTYNGSMPNAVTVSTISVGLNTTIPVSKGDSMAFLDTGTNDIVLPERLYNAVEAAVCGGNPTAHCHSFFQKGACAALTPSQLDAYPEIVLHLDKGVELRMASRDYLLFGSPAAASADEVCLGIGKGGEGFFILGDTAMRSQYIVFTLEEVGFGKVNKKTCGSI